MLSLCRRAGAERNRKKGRLREWSWRSVPRRLVRGLVFGGRIVALLVALGWGRCHEQHCGGDGGAEDCGDDTAVPEPKPLGQDRYGAEHQAQLDGQLAEVEPAAPGVGEMTLVALQGGLPFQV